MFIRPLAIDRLLIARRLLLVARPVLGVQAPADARLAKFIDRTIEAVVAGDHLHVGHGLKALLKAGGIEIAHRTSTLLVVWVALHHGTAVAFEVWPEAILAVASTFLHTEDRAQITAVVVVGGGGGSLRTKGVLDVCTLPIV